MDTKSAHTIKQHVERAIEELSLALTLAKEASPADEFLRLRTSVCDIIARIDTMLQDNIYNDHPGLDGMSEEKPRGVLKLVSEKAGPSRDPAPIVAHETMRTSAELDPLVKQVAANGSLMRKFRETVGCDDEARVRAVIDEIRSYAASIDPKLTYAEGAKLALLLADYR
jgi:hypothetical protein